MIRKKAVTIILVGLTLIMSVPETGHAKQQEVNADDLIVAFDNNGDEQAAESVPDHDFDGYICVLKEGVKEKNIQKIEEKIEQLDDEDIASEVVENRIYEMDSLETIDQIVDAREIEYIEPNYTMHMDDEQAASFNDPMYSDNSWIYDSLDIQQVWNTNVTGKGQGLNKTPVVGVIDTGIAGFSDSSRRHEDLDYKKIPEVLYDTDHFVNADENSGYKHSGHGTFVIGVISAVMNNKKGVVGLMPDVTIFPYKINNGDDFDTARIVTALDRMIKVGYIDVINMSIGGTNYSKALEEKCREAADKGIILVASSGNSWDNTKQYPASYPGVISVGSINKSSSRSAFSTYNEEVDCTAPAGDSTYVNGIPQYKEGVYGLDYTDKSSYIGMNGTSFSTPMVSALAAMVKSVDPSADHDVFMNILEKTSRDLGTKGKDQYYGFGCVDFWQAYVYIRSNKYTNETVSVSLPQTEYSYTGDSITPVPAVQSSLGFNLREGVHYTVSYSNNQNPGTGTVKVVGIGRYAGLSSSNVFTIISNEPTPLTFDYLYLSSYEYTFTGEPIHPAFGVKLSDGTYAKYPEDYVIEYENCVSAGTATVIATGIGRLSGTVTRDYTILPCSLEDEDAVKITLSASEFTYTGKRIKPEVTITNKRGVLLQQGEDYSLKYSNNTNAGTGKVVIQGTGNYTGKVTKQFEIIDDNQPRATVSSLELTGYEYTYCGANIYPGMYIKLSDGAAVKIGENCQATYSNCKDAGTATVTVVGIGNYTGSVSRTFRIVPKSIEEEDAVTVSLPAWEYDYTGVEITPTVSVTDNGSPLIKGIDYTVSYLDNEAVGTAEIIINGKGNYKGTRSEYFEIVDVKVGKGKVKSLKAGKKKVRVRVANISNAERYQYAYKKKGGSFKYRKSSSKSVWIKGLKSKKYYYFKVRGIHYLDNGEVIYGKWSSAKRIRVK